MNRLTDFGEIWYGNLLKGGVLSLVATYKTSHLKTIV